jgi:hypothetical protein
MGAAWVLVALIERAVSHDQLQIPVPDDEEPEVRPEPRESYRGLLRRRRESAAEPVPVVTAPIEERPSSSHVRRIEPEPHVLEPAAAAGEPEPAVIAEETELKPEPEPVPGPAVSGRLPELPGLEAEPQAEPVPEPEPEPAPKPVPPPRPARIWRRSEAPLPPPEPSPTPEPAPPPVHEPPREWNLWDLERRARERGDVSRDEEWAALFMHLREFANADGVLPQQFDGLVRESFAELIEVG